MMPHTPQCAGTAPRMSDRLLINVSAFSALVVTGHTSTAVLSRSPRTLPWSLPSFSLHFERSKGGVLFRERAHSRYRTRVVAGCYELVATWQTLVLKSRSGLHICRIRSQHVATSPEPQPLDCAWLRQYQIRCSLPRDPAAEDGLGQQTAAIYRIAPSSASSARGGGEEGAGMELLVATSTIQTVQDHVRDGFGGVLPREGRTDDGVRQHECIPRIVTLCLLQCSLGFRQSPKMQLGNRLADQGLVCRRGSRLCKLLEDVVCLLVLLSALYPDVSM